MFPRSESARERALLRIINTLEQGIRNRDETIREQNDRIMFLAGRTWDLPVAAEGDEPELVEVGVSASDTLPDDFWPEPEAA